MKPLALRTYPDSCLRVKTKKVKQFSAEIREKARAMTAIMYAKQGIGLAATQAGMGIRMAVVDTGDNLMTLINPEILVRSREKDTMEEGCLSLPGVCVTMKRSSEIEVRAYDLNGTVFTKKFKDLEAIAIQHEVDHLNGKLIIDYLSPLARFIAVRKLMRASRTGEKL